jgi:hypothetical protein
MAIVLNGTTGIAVPLGSASSPAETNTTSATTGIYYPTSTTLGLSTNGTNAVTINASQNVGIGTTSPSQKLTVVDATSANMLLSGSTTNFITYAYSGFAVSGTTSNTPWLFYTNNTEQMRIDSSGNVAIGTTTGGVKFSVASVGVADTVLLRQNGAVGATVQTAIGFQNAASTYVGSISCNGTATAYNVASDYRLKENVRPLTMGLATISALKPVNYDWISDKSQGEGFIAHELQAVIPHAVVGEKDAINEDGSIKPQGVDYSKIVVHLVAAIQELSAEVEALKAKVGA